MSVKKKISKSIRINEDVCDFIESQPGKTFTDKFEYLVRVYKDDEIALKKRLSRLEEQIEHARTELDRTCSQVRVLDNSVSDLVHISKMLHQIREQIDQL